MIAKSLIRAVALAPCPDYGFMLSDHVVECGRTVFLVKSNITLQMLGPADA